MTPQERLEAFAQSVYLTKNNRYYDDITGEDGQSYVAQTIDWANLLVDELEREADWNCVRDNDHDFGVIATPTSTFALPATIRKLVVDADRPLVIMQDGSIVSTWEVVDPNQITRRTPYPSTAQRVTVVKRSIVFSRPLDDTEVGGTVIADAIEYLPRLVGGVTPNVDLFDTFEPYQLLVLGVAKNATLPDIVQGGLSPSYVQKYNDLLDKSVMENDASSTADEVVRDDYGYIGGS